MYALHFIQFAVRVRIFSDLFLSGHIIWPRRAELLC